MKALARVALLLAVVVPRALAGTTTGGRDGGLRDGEVKGVSVLPAAGRVEIVIDLQGAALVQDFTLSSPARLVIDLQGTRLTAPVALYDGQNRGGVRNVRYAQFKPDVVRVVIDLDALKDYQIERAAGQVRVRIGTERTAFAAWSSSTVTPEEMEAMVDFSLRYMKANVVDGKGDGIVTYSGNRRTTHAMDREERLWVYGRQGQECRRCGAMVMMRKQGEQARSTYWCPECQPWVGEGIAPVGKAMVVRRGKVGC